MAPQRGAAAAEDQRRESGVNARIVDRLEHLQTGTGKLHNTAISTAAITAVIFNLVDRTMASLRTRANLSAALYAPSRAYAVTAITLRPAASRVYRRAPLVAFGAWHTSHRPGTPDFWPHEEP